MFYIYNAISNNFSCSVVCCKNQKPQSRESRAHQFSNKKRINGKASLSSENSRFKKSKKCTKFEIFRNNFFSDPFIEHLAKISNRWHFFISHRISIIFEVLERWCFPLSFFIFGFSILSIDSIPVIESKNCTKFQIFRNNFFYQKCEHLAKFWNRCHFFISRWISIIFEVLECWWSITGI